MRLYLEVLEDRVVLSGLPGPDDQVTAAWVPNDPLFSSQPGMSNAVTPGAGIQAPAAWGVTTGTRRMVVAVVDTGIDYDHPDLYKNIWINQAEIPAARRKNLVDVDHDGLITFADLNNPINIGPGKITDVSHDGRIDASDILAPMVRDANGHDTGLGGWAYPGNTQDGDTAHPNDFIGWNFAYNDNDPFDDNGHGTRVAGIIGAMGNNGAGIAGVDWQVLLMPVKFLNGYGNGNTAAATAAVNYAVAHGAKVSNNSWQETAADPGLEAALANARAHGQIVVAAAGNNGSDLAASPVYPAGFRLDNVVAVAASDSTGNLAAFSNYGAGSVALAAPGVNVLSTTPGKSYGPAVSGTSFAAPHVSGVLALVWGLRPEWSYAQVLDQVLDTATPLPGLRGKVEAGEVNAAAAVRVPPRPTLPAVFQPAAVASTGTPAGASRVRIADSPSIRNPQSAIRNPVGLDVHAAAPATVGVPLPGGTSREVDAFFTSPGAVTGIEMTYLRLRRRWPQLVVDPPEVDRGTDEE